MRRTLRLAVLLSLCGCNQPVEGLDDALRGCFVTRVGAPATDVAVFLVRDDVAQREVRTSADGCFALEGLAPGRWVLAAHDFRGDGLLEAVHDVAGLFRPMGVRTLAPMEFDARWSRLRGLGLPEVLAPSTTSSTLVTCGSDVVTASDRGVVARLDVRSGERQRSMPIIEVEARPPGPGRFGLPDEVVALRWTSGREPIALPEGTDSWATVAALNDTAFVASAGRRTTQSVSVTTWVYGAAGRLVVVGRSPCRLAPSGVCVRDEGAMGATRWSPDGRVTTLNLAGGEAPLWVASEPSGERVLVVHRGAGALIASVRRFDGTTVAETPLPGAEVEPLATGAALTNFWSFVTVTAEGSRRWVRVGVARGDVAEVPAPVRPAGVIEVPATGVGAWEWPRLEWMSRDGEAWVVTVLEHALAGLRTRSLRVPALAQPNFVFSEGLEFFPGFALASVEAAGLEVLRVGDGATVLQAGAPLDSGRPFPVMGLRQTAECSTGGFLTSRGLSPALAPQVVVLDVARLARELGVTPATQ